MTTNESPADDIVPAYIDLAADAANEVRNLPPGSPAVYVVVTAVFADDKGRLYIRGDYEWSTKPQPPRAVQIRRLPDSRLVIESTPRRVSVQDPKHCFERWYGEYLFQVVDTAEVAEQ